MNRNNRKSVEKTLQKTYHTQSWAGTNQKTQGKQFYSSNQTHFLNVTNVPEAMKKTSKQGTKPKFEHHFASKTQLISTPFQQKAYVPPHLNSSQVFTCMTSECQNWRVRPSSSCSKQLNYDSLYRNLESKYEKAVPCGSRLKKWTTGSKIKNMVEEDRTRFQFRKPYKLFVEERSGSEPQDLYMDDSSLSEDDNEQNYAASKKGVENEKQKNGKSTVQIQNSNVSAFAAKTTLFT